MLSVLTLASLFPSDARPNFGIFVERQTLGLAALDDVEVRVAAPVGMPPWPLSLHPHYREARRLPVREQRHGLDILRPRFRALPGLANRNATAMARALVPVLRDLRADFPFDVIDAEFFWPDGVAAMHLARDLNVPFSVKARGSDIHYWGRQPAIAVQMIEASKAAGGLLAVSAALAADMAQLGMDATKISVHHTGIDRAIFAAGDRAAAKAALGVSGPLILTVGALIPLKGQKLALEALAHLPDATLILAGDGPDRPALEALARPYAERVRFLGEVAHARLPALLQAADVMLLPSEREGLANVWLEALACDTPIVIADAGGAREVVDRPAAGRIVARDPQAIAAAIRDILADPPTLDAVAATVERFSWETNARELRAHLQAMAGVS